MATSTSTPTTGPETSCWTGAPPGRVPLSAKNLRLRPLRDDDAAAIARLAGDWEVARWTAYVPHPYEPAQAQAFIAEARAKAEAGTAYAFAAERIADGVFLGCFECRVENGEADFSYWIGRDYWNGGYATEAVRRVARFAFRDLNLAAVRAGTMTDNQASARVLEKAGFSFEGASDHAHGRCTAASNRFGLSRAAWEKHFVARPVLLVSAAALVDADGRVLVARRPPGKAMAGLWEFPGGKVGAGETPEAALIRELAEELSLDVRESCLAPVAFASHDYDDFHLLMPLFACRVWKGTPTPKEGQELRWLAPARLADLPMPPADVPLVPLLRDLL
ncbi:MAG: GNAT family N-acetyltransferase [Alphaproteobacteria bacterium]|nr:GNAT family N-acetyltransferase [Alphaproteobacteria bacterium]